MTRFCLSMIFAGLMSAMADRPVLTPPPRHAEWTGLSVALEPPVIRAGSAERPAALFLETEMRRLHGLKLAVTSRPGAGGISLALAGTAAGRNMLGRVSVAGIYKRHRGPETYLIETGPGGVSIVAETLRGLIYGAQTLLQMVRREGVAKRVVGARIVDYPQLGFRGLHICIFPNTELAAVRQAILVAARFKYNAIVIETWASLKSRKRPESAYENAYEPEQLKPLVRLGKALQMEMIPMLNSWGHASGMRAGSSQHVVLDRFPQFKALYEEDGWSFCLTNPDIYGHLFDRYQELLELFDKPSYFHLGLDEAWGHRGLMESERCRGPNPTQVIREHLAKLYDYFARRKTRVMVWHDMFIQRDHPELGRVSPANSLPGFNTHLALDSLPKDVIIAAWNYSETGEWPVPKYFSDRGFPVVVCPWKVRRNAVSLVNTAKKLELMGMLQTTWDSLDVTLPTVGEAGVVAWTEPGFNLDTVPYETFLKAIRDLPICNLPHHESILGGGQ